MSRDFDGCLSVITPMQRVERISHWPLAMEQQNSKHGPHLLSRRVGSKMVSSWHPLSWANKNVLGHVGIMRSNLSSVGSPKRGMFKRPTNLRQAGILSDPSGPRWGHAGIKI